MDRDSVVVQEVERIAPPSVTPQNENFIPFQYDSESDTINSPFTMEELNRAIGMIKRISAPDRDGIDYMMIKKLDTEFRISLLEIINKIWLTAIIPYLWRKFQIHFIDKIGKKKVRPIALSSCMGKLIERMVNERLIWWAENNKIIYNSQNGFRRGKSCVNNLVKITSDIKSTIYRGDYSLAAFLDVSAAYDDVQFHILSHKLVEVRCPSRLVMFLNSWLQERSTQFNINNWIEWKIERMVRKGLPQGAVLSPLLYDIYTANIAEDIPESVRIVQFVDDIAVYTMGQDRRGNKNSIYEALGIIDNNLSEIGLHLEPKKTSVIEFSRSGFVDCNMNINYNGKKIRNTAETRFLGIILDNQLKFEKHISYIRGKMEKANQVVKFVCGVSRRPELNTALMLYKSLVRAVSDYGCFVYALVTRRAETKLERGQFQGLRTALGYRNSTPTNVIVAEAKLTYLHDRALFLAKNFCVKVRKFGPEDLINSIEELCLKESLHRIKNRLQLDSIIVKAWNSLKKHTKSLGRTEEGFNIWKMNYNILTYNIRIDLEYGTQYFQLEKKSFETTNLELLSYGDQDKALIGAMRKHNMTSRPLIIYTDGSRSEKSLSTEANMVCDEENIAYYISMLKNCLIFTAETFAIKTVLNVLLHSYRSKGYEHKNILIFSDCQGILKAMLNNNLSVYHNQYTLEARYLYWELSNQFKVNIYLILIPSHRGFIGNEIADQLAKQGAIEKADESIHVPFQDLSYIFREEE